MPTTIVMDPVTRIEGHMKVEVSIDNYEIVDARCTGTLFRGFETLLEGKDPWDAPVITQRICGVCPISHGQASVLTLENAAGYNPPTNGRLIRNLILGSNFISSHILHFYLLAALDYVRGPDVSPWVPLWEVDFRDGLDSVIGHLGQALEARRRAQEMATVFAGKMPASHVFMPGGVTSTPTNSRIKEFRGHLNWLTNFIRDVYIKDVEKVAGVYTDYFEIGEGCRNLLAFGVFEEDEGGSRKLLGPGYIENNGDSIPGDLSHGDVTESVTYSWYHDSTNNLTPAEGRTLPQYPKSSGGEEAYSWLKAPRFKEKPFEVGPLARMKVNREYNGGISVMDRHAARAEETLIVAQAMSVWLNQLRPGGPVFNDEPYPSSAFGVGMTEAPRGALAHWVEVSQAKISHYQVVTPTCWNASPMDDRNVNGPMEQALIGTPIEDPGRPIEALRVIHAFDPCLSCAVHVMRPDGEPIVIPSRGL